MIAGLVQVQLVVIVRVLRTLEIRNVVDNLDRRHVGRCKGQRRKQEQHARIIEARAFL